MNLQVVYVSCLLRPGVGRWSELPNVYFQVMLGRLQSDLASFVASLFSVFIIALTVNTTLNYDS